MKYFAAVLLSAAAITTAIADQGHEGLPPGNAVLQRAVTGAGEWKYETVPGWGLLPTNQPPGPTHGSIAIDKAGNIYVSTDAKLGILVFKADGTFLRSMAPQFSGIHGMVIRAENGEEFIYAAWLKGNQALKLKLDGTPVWKIEVPMESGKYKSAGQFKPTSIAVAPDRSIFVADGYGASVIHKFDASQKYVKTFGSDDAGEGKFKTCHGIAIDTRGGATPTLLVCDRENRRISRFDLDGKFIAVLTKDLRRPCAMSIQGDNIAVAELEGRVALLDKENKVVGLLGDNPNPKERANYGVAPANWIAGIFTAPHGVCWAADGTVYVQDWNSTGRLTKLVKVQ